MNKMGLVSQDFDDYDDTKKRQKSSVVAESLAKLSEEIIKITTLSDMLYESVVYVNDDCKNDCELVKQGTEITLNSRIDNITDKIRSINNNLGNTLEVIRSILGDIKLDRSN